MEQRVLVTGGAGFIGSHVADELLESGYRVRALDALVPQVHGGATTRPPYLDERVELVRGELGDPRLVEEALTGVDAVIHLASAVGVGQSMYEIAHYTRANQLATAVLMEALSRRPVRRLVMASSMSLYGEGLYLDAHGRPVEQAERRRDDLAAGRWEPKGPEGEPLHPMPTPESKRPVLASVYALGKYDQERMCLMVGEAYGIPTTALRLFNVYGPRQALSNPYTGVLAIFASRLLNGRAPLVFEDGRQRRDFVSVHDVSRAFRLALESEATGAFNVGSGRSFSILEVAERLGDAVGRRIAPEITGRFRVGDIRHCFADISSAEEALGYRPEVDFDAGLAELAGWLREQTAEDRVEEARAALEARGLTV